MSRSTDAGHFFQTSSALSESDRKAAKSKNNLGHPIRLTSKLLAVIPDPRSDNAVLVAESAGCVRRVVLDQSKSENKHSETYTGPEAPLTSLTISPDSSTLFAGCWDKSIWSWDLGTRQQKQKYLGHADFIKCVTTARLPALESSPSTASTLDILISGSADGAIILWNIGSSAKLHVLKPGSRGVLDFAISPIPLLSPESSSQHQGSTTIATAPKGIDLFTAHSDKSIHHFYITATSATQLSFSPTSTSSSASSQVNLATAHETSVDALSFHAQSDQDLELWTASADKTAKGFSYIPDSTTSTSNSENSISSSGAWTLDTTLPHPDFVRAVLALANRVVTACRDENVQVWDASTGESVAVLMGHWEEVTGLCTVNGNSGGNTVVSVSIDGTVRSWRVDAAGLQDARTAEEEWTSGAADKTSNSRKDKGVALTEDEERELAELMDEDDDD